MPQRAASTSSWRAHEIVVRQAGVVPAVVADAAKAAGLTLVPDTTTYFLGRESVRGRGTGAMGRLAEALYGILQRNAVAADSHFQIPPEQVIEIGIQLDL